MMYNALQKLFVGVAVLAFAAISPVAATGNVYVLSDLENGTNQNAFGQYWYVYDDHNDKGNTKITNLTPNPADTGYNFLPTAGVGNTVAGGTQGYGAEIDFQLGTTNPGNADATWGSMAAMGTMLAPAGEYFDLTGAEKIEFYAKIERPKGTAAQVDLRVEVCTEELKADNGYYHIILPLTGTWTKFTIPLDTVEKGYGKLVQWDWSITNNGAKPFNIKKVSQIQWCVSEDGNVVAWKDASGALFLDDITISPFTPHFADEIEINKLGPAGAGTPPTSLLAGFDITPLLKNTAGYYTYAYTDIDANPTAGSASVITAGAILNDTTKKYTLTASDGGVAGSCASIAFQLGTNFVEAGGTNSVQPFVGIGTNLVAEVGGAPAGVCNITPATAVYFDYKLTGTAIPFVTFELKTDQDFGNKGAVYYVKLPNTNGAWKGATVDLSGTELVLPKWKDVTAAPLDKTKALKLQWKAQGTARAEGTLAIDNVYLPGWTADVIHFGNRPMLTSAFSVKQQSNLAQVSFALPQSVSNARVDLVSMQGKVLASQSIKRNNGSEYQVAFPTSKLANGSYFVKVNYDNKDVKSSMFSIIR